MLSTPLRKRNLTSIPQQSFPIATAQKSRSRQKNRSRSKGAFPSSNGQSYQLSKKNCSIKAYHFSDSIYQGQIKAFHRVGKGLIVHDNGLTGIIKSGSNRLKDHNVFFGQNILISGIYKEHELDFMYKNGNNILVLNMQKKGNQIALNSVGYMIEFDFQRVSRLKFRNNTLIEKLLLTRQETEQIINQQKFNKIMKEQHIEALKFNLFDSAFPQLDLIPKHRNQMHIGFSQLKPLQYSTTYQLSYKQKDYHNKNLQGLGMIIQKISHDPHKQFRYEFRIFERGFYSNGKLQYFGQQFYVNGNYYFGGIKDQQMHGNGILVYPNQNRFVYGKFSDGKPIKLDESFAYRLDTEEGRNLYTNFRKRLHSQDPQVWIDNQVQDLPDQEYFMEKLHECSHFAYQDKQINNFLKHEQELRLSRKVEDFQKQSRNSHSISDKFSNTMSFGPKDVLNKQFSNPFEREDFTQQIKRQVQQQGIKRAIGSQLINTQSSPLFPFGSNQNGNSSISSTPIRRMNSDTFQHSNNHQNNPSINDSIIQRFNLDGNNSSSSNMNSRIINQSNEIKLSQHSMERKQKQSPSRKQNALQTAYNINIRSPIEGSRSSYHSTERSVSRSGSRSASKSLSRASSKSQGSKRNFVKQNIELTKTFQRSPQAIQKRSILDRLYGEANNRAQVLQREYEMLEQQDKSRNSSNKQSSKRLSPGTVPTNYSNSPDKSYHYSGYKEEPNQIDRKLMKAANQSLRLANSNKVKEEKYLQYEHYTHKKKFDYTSQSFDERVGRPYGHIGVLSKQTYYQRTPQKVAKYDNYENIQTNRTAKKQLVNNVVNRLYPQHSTQQFVSSKMPQNVYDSRYEQQQPLNKYGITRGDERKSRLQQDESGGKYSYGKDFKGSVLRHNAIVKS